MSKRRAAIPEVVLNSEKEVRSHFLRPSSRKTPAFYNTPFGGVHLRAVYEKLPYVSTLKEYFDESVDSGTTYREIIAGLKSNNRPDAEIAQILLTQTPAPNMTKQELCSAALISGVMISENMRKKGADQLINIYLKEVASGDKLLNITTIEKDFHFSRRRGANAGRMQIGEIVKDVVEYRQDGNFVGDNSELEKDETVFDRVNRDFGYEQSDLEYFEQMKRAQDSFNKRNSDEGLLLGNVPFAFNDRQIDQMTPVPKDVDVSPMQPEYTSFQQRIFNEFNVDECESNPESRAAAELKTSKRVYYGEEEKKYIDKVKQSNQNVESWVKKSIEEGFTTTDKNILSGIAHDLNVSDFSDLGSSHVQAPSLAKIPSKGGQSQSC